jgi:sulfur-carrier protein adenylyltransferase/sulfurtransferase
MKLLSLIPRSEHGNEIREIAPHQLARMKPHPLIIDVREEREYLLGHIEGAIHLHRNTLESKVPEITPELDTPIVIYCATGTACAAAAETLRRLGYQKIFSLKGGLQNWLEAGGLVESSKSRVKAC